MNDIRTCRAHEGGTPKCGLASSGCLTVEVRGNTCPAIFESRSAKRNVADPLLTLSKDKFDIMIVGEAPGAVEDERGLPFQGSAGAKLESLIGLARMPQDRIFITNLVRCRPPDNRKPTQTESIACAPHLLAELKAIQPKVVVLMGASALKAFNLHNIGGITLIRGSIHKLKFPGWDDGPEFTVIPTLHPAHLLYQNSPKTESRVVDDLVLAASVVAGHQIDNSYDVQYKVTETITDFDKVMDEVGSQPFFAFDTETRSLEWWREPLITIQLCWGHPGGHTAVIPWYLTCDDLDPDRLEPWNLKPLWSQQDKDHIRKRLTELFENENIGKGAHNMKFDMNVLRKHLCIEVKGFLWDSMCLHHLLWEHRPHKLEELADLEFCTGDYSKRIRDIVGHGDKKKKFDLIPNNMLWKYGAADAELTYRLCSLYSNSIVQKPNLWSMYTDEVEPGIHTLVEAEWNGIPVDADTTRFLMEDFEAKKEDILVKARKLTNPTFNPGSPQQVADVLVEMGFGEHIKTKEKGKYSTNENNLNKFKDQCPLAELVLDYRHYNKMASTYLAPVLELMDEEGRFHTSFKQHGTKTGRYAAAVLHQIERLDDEKTAAGIVQMRHAYWAGPGRDYVHLDYSQVELKVMAIESNDPELLRAVFYGDAHTETAATFLKMSAEEFRNHPYYLFNRASVGKRINFGIGYGSEGYNLVRTGRWKDEKGRVRNITWKMLDEGMEEWRARFHVAVEFLANLPDIARDSGGIITNAFGRERRFGDELWSPEKGIRSRAERELINFIIQGAAGSLMNRLLNSVHFKILEYVRDGSLSRGDVQLYNTVHDSGGWGVLKYLTPWFVDFLKATAEQPVPQLKNYVFSVDVGAGNCWAEAEIAAK